jgi:hypothetical protein
MNFRFGCNVDIFYLESMDICIFIQNFSDKIIRHLLEILLAQEGHKGPLYN